jgi:hypothetical protein
MEKCLLKMTKCLLKMTKCLRKMTMYIYVFGTFLRAPLQSFADLAPCLFVYVSLHFGVHLQRKKYFLRFCCFCASNDFYCSDRTCTLTPPTYRSIYSQTRPLKCYKMPMKVFFCNDEKSLILPVLLSFSSSNICFFIVQDGWPCRA